jgi:hypothetical protein
MADVMSRSQRDFRLALQRLDWTSGIQIAVGAVGSLGPSRMLGTLLYEAKTSNLVVLRHD